MCLDVADNHPSDKPYNKTKIRWKVLRKLDLNRHNFLKDVRWSERQFVSPYRSDFIWQIGKWRKAETIGYDYTTYGIHVFVNKKDAIVEMNDWGCRDCLVIAKIEVDGFLMAGKFEGAKSETWKKARILEVCA